MAKGRLVMLLFAAVAVASVVAVHMERATRRGALYYRDIIENASSRHGVAPELIAAVIDCESGGRATAVSSAGAVGLMQLMPATAEELAIAAGMPGMALTDPEDNITLGAMYLAQMMRTFGGEVVYAVAAYNAGPRRVREWIADRRGQTPEETIARAAFSETARYTDSVVSRMKYYIDNRTFSSPVD